jgi:hypothetical protein
MITMCRFRYYAYTVGLCFDILKDLVSIYSDELKICMCSVLWFDLNLRKGLRDFHSPAIFIAKVY